MNLFIRSPYTAALTILVAWLPLAATGEVDDGDTLNPFSETLAQASVIAVGKVLRVDHTARSTDVVQFELVDVLKSKKPKGLEAGDKVTILASRGTFFVNTKLLVLLKPFGGGPRFESFARITESDVDFRAKVRVMREYLRIDAIDSPAKRRDALRRLVLRNVESPDSWTRWNALHTLETIVSRKPDLLKVEDLKGLRSVAARLSKGEFRVALEKLLAKLEKRERAA